MIAPLDEETYMTPEEYLAFEEASPLKHEYVNGYVHEMAGVTRTHSRITTNILVALHNQLKGKPCEVLGSKMRMQFLPPGRAYYYYPDLTVDCSGKDTPHTEEPTVLFEVLSSASQRADEGDKLINYLNLPSMRVYVIVDQRRPHITVHRRTETGWQQEIMDQLTGILELPEIACTLPLEIIYERVQFDS